MNKQNQNIEYWINQLDAEPSTKYPGRYDVGYVDLSDKNLTEIPIPFGFVDNNFHCAYNELTTLNNAPIEVGDFSCQYNKLTTLDHLPKYIGNLSCGNNPFQNLNALKDVTIKGVIWFSHRTENELDYYIKALYNTDLDALEWHYDNHKYEFWNNRELENYVMNELEEIIKVKSIKKHLNL